MRKISKSEAIFESVLEKILEAGDDKTIPMRKNVDIDPGKIDVDPVAPGQIRQRRGKGYELSREVFRVIRKTDEETAGGKGPAWEIEYRDPQTGKLRKGEDYQSNIELNSIHRDRKMPSMSMALKGYEPKKISRGKSYEKISDLYAKIVDQNAKLKDDLSACTSELDKYKGKVRVAADDTGDATPKISKK